jgi:outer membrane protein TolC
MNQLANLVHSLRCVLRTRRRESSLKRSSFAFGFPGFRRATASLVIAGMLLPGCSTTQKTCVQDLQYLDGEKPVQYYKDHNTAIEHPCLRTQTDDAVAVSQEPRNLRRLDEDEVREISLQETIRIALGNNDVIATSGLGGVGGKLVLTNPSAGVSTVYDSAIQETGILFGRRGLEAALADFDTRLSSSFSAGRASDRSNLAGGVHSTAEIGQFNSSLTKALATGANIQVYNNWDYLGTNSATALFPSTYNSTIGAQIRQPLLAGGGVEFTRIAGPSDPAFGSITGVSQGILIARINQDISLADFESAVIQGLRDLENSYWDLYLNYRRYDTAAAAHQAAFSTWRVEKDKEEVGVGLLENELQARDRLYETRASMELALNEIYKSEAEVRRLMGLPMNDGTILRPADEPTVAEIRPDWDASVLDGLVHRVELRQQKWQIKSLQLQLSAARSLVRPRLDAIADYGVNGFGDRAFGSNVNGPGGQPVGNAYGSMVHDDLESWTLGMQFSMPLGLRQARSQVRNLELQLARANAILNAQERDIAHDIATAIQDVAANYKAAQSSESRYNAAIERARILMEAEKLGRKETTVDLVLRAQESAAQAERAYFEQVISYNKAITALHLATGKLLDFNHVYLAEGRWSPEAYDDAMLRAVGRTHAKDNPHLESSPGPFASPAPVDDVEIRRPVKREPGSAVPAPPEEASDVVPTTPEAN